MIACHHQDVANQPLVGVGGTLRQPGLASRPGIKLGQGRFAALLTGMHGPQCFKHYLTTDTHTCAGEKASLGTDEGHRNIGLDDIPFGGTKSDGKVFAGRRVGALQAGPTITIDEYPAGADLQDIVVSDVDGDGLVDLVATSGTNNTIALLLQDTASPGDFESALQIPAGTDPGSLTTIDFDEDGNMDLASVTTDGGGNRIVRVLQNDGNLSFTSLDLAEGEFPLLVDAGDINGDGSNDLVTIGDGGSSLRSGDGTPLLALRATESLCDCDGDTDCDSDVDVEDLLSVIAEYGCTENCQADANGDGAVNVEDVLAVISGWGGC